MTADSGAIAETKNDTTEILSRIVNLETGHSEMKEKIDTINSRLGKVESIGEDVSQILGVANKLARYIKIWAPTIVAAAISAGVVNGKLGAFLHALLSGAN